jgi:hypothetical protein
MKFLYVAVAALGLALLPLPYAGYQAVKWIVTLACSFAAFKLHQKQITGAPFWGLAFIAVLFNPLAPFYMSRTAWILWDIVAATFILWFVSKDDALGQAAAAHGSDSDISQKIERAGDKFSSLLIWSSLATLVALALLAYLFHF